LTLEADLPDHVVMSERCQQLTHALQQKSP
jgi:hypothetical protein